MNLRARKILVLLILWGWQQGIYADTDSYVSPEKEASEIRLTEQGQKINNMPYDETLYNTAYDVFLKNGNVKDAFAVAQSAVRQKPDSVIWQDRLLQTAVWTGQMHFAFNKLYEAVINKNNNKYLDQAIKLGFMVHEYKKLTILLEHGLKISPHKALYVLDLAKVYDHEGYVDKAISLLNTEERIKPNLEYLQMLVVIYRENNNSLAEEKILKEINTKYSFNAKATVRLAEMKYIQGDIADAINILKNNEKITDDDYLSTLGDLSWLSGNVNLSRSAYTKLHNLKNSTITSEQTRRLIVLLSDKDPSYALRLTLAACKKYHTINFCLMALTFAIKLQDYATLSAIYADLSPEERRQLNNEWNYWYGQAVLLQHGGDPVAARQILWTAYLQNLDDSETFQVGYLDFLIYQNSLYEKHNDPVLLFNTMQVWQVDLAQKPYLWSSFANGYQLFNKDRLAFMLYEAQLKSMQNDTAWLLLYADLAERMYHYKTAYLARQRSWQSLMMQLEQENVAKNDPEFWIIFSKAALYSSSGDYGYFPIAAMIKNKNSMQTIDELLSWAIAHDENELAMTLINYYYSNNVPTWAELSIALQENDTAKLKEMLETASSTLPAVDRVNAAEQMDAIPLAQDLAFDNLEKKPDDSDEYQQLQDVMLRNANTFSMTTEYQQFGALVGPRIIARSKNYFTPAWSFNFEYNRWFTRTNNTAVLINVPSYDQMLVAGLERKTKWNDYKVELTQRSAVYSYYGIGLFGNQQINQQLTLGGQLGYNQKTELSDLMLISGVQDEAVLHGDYQFNARDSLLGQFSADRYLTQGRVYLGNGYLLQGEYDHKITLAYPEYMIGIFGNTNYFGHANPSNLGRVANLIPANANSKKTILVPNNFWESGVTFHMGDSIREDYTHAWRPYVVASLFYDSTTHFGELIDGGIASSMFGRDKLALYVTHSSNSQGLSQQSYLLGIRYQVFY